MKVAVAGGTGFLGRPLVHRLLAAGHAVTVLTRRPDAAAASLPAGAVARGYAPQSALDVHGLEGTEAIINLAGEPVAQRWTHAHKERILHSRVDMTRALVQTARELGTVRTFLSTSAVGYYGTPAGTSLTEESPPGSDFLAQVCVAWEQAAAAAREAGIRTPVVRVGVALHPEGGALKPLVRQFKLGTGGPVGNGKQYVSWVHREDVVALFLLALERTDWNGPVNATSPNPVTNRDFAHALGHALHRPASLPVPAFVVRAALGEMAMLATEGQCALPKRALDAGYTFLHPSLEETLQGFLQMGRSLSP